MASKTHEEKIASQELLKAAQQQLDEMGNMCDRAITQSQDAQKTTAHLKKESEKSEEAAALLKSELDQISAAFGDCGNLESRLNRLRHYKKEADKAVKHREELKFLTTKVSKLKSEISQLQDTLKKAEENWQNNRVEQHKPKERTSKSEATKARAEISRLQDELRDVRAQIQEAAEALTSNRAEVEEH
jgi:chromosome segregation ATPase